jgi:hypothetical protein
LTDVDKNRRGILEMYDLIASWMTSGGPLQELHRDERGRIHDARPTAEPTMAGPTVADERHAHRLSFAFVRGARAGQTMTTATCIDGCAAC